MEELLDRVKFLADLWASVSAEFRDDSISHIFIGGQLQSKHKVFRV